MRRSILAVAATLLLATSAAGQAPDASGRIVTCRFKKLPRAMINMTWGREALIIGDRSFTVQKGSGFWSAGPYLLAFNGETANRKGVKVWIKNEGSGVEDNAVCRSSLRSH